MIGLQAHVMHAWLTMRARNEYAGQYFSTQVSARQPDNQHLRLWLVLACSSGGKYNGDIPAGCCLGALQHTQLAQHIQQTCVHPC